MSEIQKLLAPAVGRVETGPVQFGEDWPGIFIRGDNAAYMAMVLRTVLDGGHDEQSDVIGRLHLRGLLELLNGSNVGPTRMQPHELNGAEVLASQQLRDAAMRAAIDAFYSAADDGFADWEHIDIAKGLDAALAHLRRAGIF